MTSRLNYKNWKIRKVELEQRINFLEDTRKEVLRDVAVDSQQAIDLRYSQQINAYKEQLRWHLEERPESRHVTKNILLVGLILMITMIGLFAINPELTGFVTVNVPGNATADADSYRVLNVTVKHPDGPFINVSIYGGNNTSPDKLLRHYEHVLEGANLTYNWTSPTIDMVYKNDPTLVAYYKFDNNGSNYGTFEDVSFSADAYANTTDGYIGGGLSLDGTGDYVSTTNTFEIKGSQNRTVAFWAKAGDAAGTDSILSWGDTTSGGDFRPILRATGHGGDQNELQVAVSSGNRIWTLVHAVGEWVHVVVVTGGTSTSNLVAYGNGEELSIKSTAARGLDTGSSKLYIGARNDATNLYNGELDEVAIWNRSLGSEEIIDLFRLRNETYYWKAVADNSTATNTTDIQQFLVGESPTVSLNSPDDTSTESTSNSIDFNFTATQKTVALGTCTLYHNASGTFDANESVASVSSGTLTNITITISNNVIAWNVKCGDENGNAAFATSNRTLTIDVATNTAPNPPILNSPINNTKDSGRSALLNVTLIDPDGDSMNVSIYGDNSSVSSLLYFGENIANGTTITYNWSDPVHTTSEVGLVALYHLDTGVNDSLSNHNGVLTGADLNKTGGKFGGAYQFVTENSDRIEISDSADFSMANHNISLEAWFKGASFPSSQRNWIITKGKSSNYEWALYVDTLTSSDPNLVWVIWSSAGSELGRATGSTTLSTGTFYHVAATFDIVNDDMYLYLNGVEDGSDTSGTVTPSDTSSEVWIGGREDGGTKYFNGTIDEVAIYNKTLSAAEIADNFRLAADTYYWNVSVTDGSLSADSNLSQFEVEANRLPSIPTVNAPLNGTGSVAKARFLNITVIDTEGDVMNVSIYGSNTTSPDELLAFFQDVSNNSEITYNWTSPTVTTLFPSDKDLVLYYKLDQNSTDLSSQTNDGSDTSTAVNLTDGKLGGAYDFDGSNSRVTVTDHASLDVTGNLTISVWVYPQGASGNDGGWGGGIVSKYHASDQSGYHLNYEIGTAKTFKIMANSQTGAATTGTIDYNSGWYHIVGTIQGTTAKIYVNGVLNNTASVTASTANNNNVLIGQALVSHPTDRGFNGLIDEVAIFNRTLSAGEIEDMYALNEDKYHWKAQVSDITGSNTTDAYNFAVDSTNPSWVNNQTNLTTTTANGAGVYFNVTLSDANPGYYIFSWYNGTEWVNDSGVAYTDGEDVKIEKTIEISSGDINWTWYFNDTSGNQNQTDTWSITIADAADSTAPALSYVSPTPANGSGHSTTSVVLNISVIESDLSDVIFNWNGTNYTVYNDSVVLMLNFNNYSAIGENSSLVKDISRNNYSGSFTNNAFINISSGRYGGGAEFDGNTDAIEGTDLLINNDTTEYSVSLWAYPLNNSNYGYFDMRRTSAGGAFAMYATNFRNFVGCQTQNASGAFQATPTGFEVGIEKWVHLVCNKNATHMTLYVDGIQRTTISAGGIFYNDNYASWRAGATVGRSMNGTIDDIIVLNRSLSPGEIQQLYFTNLQKYNATQWYLYVNQTKATDSGLDVETYIYEAYASDSNSNWNSSGERTVIIDITYPSWANNETNLTTTTANGAGVYFNVTLSDANPGYYIFSWYNGTEWVNDSGVVFTDGEDVNVEKTIEISSGDINWTWFVNDTAGNWNKTDEWSITIGSANSAPSIPALLSPTNESSITNRTPTLFWQNASDTDGDTITYELQFDNDSDFSSPEVNETSYAEGSANTTYAITQDLAADTTFYWRVRAYDGTDYSDWNASQFEVLSSIVVSLPSGSVAFGTLGPSDTKNTTADDLGPMSVSNDGNIPINIFINATDMFNSTSADVPGLFQFQIGVNETNAYSSAITAWRDLNATENQAITSLYYPNGTNSANLANIDLLVKVPSDEKPAARTSTIYIRASS
jgi:hypothetical protein